MGGTPENGTNGSASDGTGHAGTVGPLKLGRKWDPNRFIELYRENGSIEATCKVLKISDRTVRQRRSRDPEFEQAMIDCWRFQNESMEATGYQLARHGFTEDDIREVATVQTTNDKGEPVTIRKHKSVGKKTRHFPGLLIFMLKSRMPEQYSDAAQTARLLGPEANAGLPVDARTNLRNLSPEERSGFRQFMLGVKRLQSEQGDEDTPVESNGDEFHE